MEVQPAVLHLSPLEVLPEEEEGGGPLADGEEDLQLEGDDQENDEGSLVAVPLPEEGRPARLEVLDAEQTHEDVLVLLGSFSSCRKKASD